MPLSFISYPVTCIQATEKELISWPHVARNYARIFIYMAMLVFHMFQWRYLDTPDPSELPVGTRRWYLSAGAVFGSGTGLPQDDEKPHTIIICAPAVDSK